MDLSAISKLPSYRDENEFKTFFDERIKELTLEVNSIQVLKNIVHYFILFHPALILSVCVAQFPCRRQTVITNG